MIGIRSYNEEDWPEIWTIIGPVFRAGSTYPFSPDITEAEVKRVWINALRATYVCEDKNKKIIGTYSLKPNQPALGAHVCNCGYIVDETREVRVLHRQCADSLRKKP